MPEAPVAPEQTSIAQQIKKRTDAALAAAQAGGLDAAFDNKIQEAMDKDAAKKEGKPEPKPTQPPTPPQQTQQPPVAPPAKPDAKPPEKPAPKADDLPPEILGEKKPEAKAPDKTAEQAEAERRKALEEATKGMSPAAHERFSKIEARAHNAEQANLQLKKQLETVPQLQAQISELNQKIAAANSPQKETEVEQLKKRVEELDQIIAQQALQDHPSFKAEFDAPITEEIDLVKAVVPQEVADEVSQLLSMPRTTKRDERLLQIAEGLNPIQSNKMFQSIGVIDRLATKRSARLANWKQSKISMQADDIRKQQEQEANWKNIQDVSWAEAVAAVSNKDNGLEVFRKADGLTEWNAKVDERLGQARSLLENLNSTKVAELAARAIASDEYRRLFFAQRMLVQKLNEELAALRGSSPGHEDNDGGGDSLKPDGRSFIDAAVERSGLK